MIIFVCSSSWCFVGRAHWALASTVTSLERVIVEISSVCPATKVRRERSRRMIVADRWEWFDGCCSDSPQSHCSPHCRQRIHCGRARRDSLVRDRCNQWSIAIGVFLDGPGERSVSIYAQDQRHSRADPIVTLLLWPIENGWFVEWNGVESSADALSVWLRSVEDGVSFSRRDPMFSPLPRWTLNGWWTGRCCHCSVEGTERVPGEVSVDHCSPRPSERVAVVPPLVVVLSRLRHPRWRSNPRYWPRACCHRWRTLCALVPNDRQNSRGTLVSPEIDGEAPYLKVNIIPEFQHLITTGD